ncbi:MAG: oxidoreductase [Lachnospiraceae bacterium]|nr:oxidoreductase [Lachnospiraceae bacterium]
MRIVKRVLSTYSADNFGVCSALYELGGLVVMHDASGCNSTYNTHDEPRWYNMDSLVFISGLTEKNAIFGNDDKLISDLVTAAHEFHPRFIAVCGGPLPHIIGTDFRAVAKAVERQCGIPTFGFQTNGMDSYISGAGQALEALVSMMPERKDDTNTGPAKVNILGVTPLDFSMNGSVEELRKLLERKGFKVGSTWAMGDDLDHLLKSADASVNLVVSAVGLRAAAAMEKKFGIPYVVGLPAGKKVTERIVDELRRKAVCDREHIEYAAESQSPEQCQNADILIIGEPVQSLAIRETLSVSFGTEHTRIISPMHGLPKEIISLGCEKVELEDELREACASAKHVIADPLYARLLPNERDKFIFLPHVAYSGRYYENDVPVLIGERLDRWMEIQI